MGQKRIRNPSFFFRRIDGNLNAHALAIAEPHFGHLRKIYYPVFVEVRSRFRIEEGLRYHNALFRIGYLHFSEFFEPIFQRESAHVLYLQSCPCVDFQQFWSLRSYYPIEGKVSEIGKELDFGRIQQDGIPMRYAALFIWGVSFRKTLRIVLSVDEAARYFTVSNVESESHSSLSEIRLSFRLVGRHSNHCRNGHEVEYDDSDVGETVLAKGGEIVGRNERFFYEYGVGSRSNRVFSLEDIRKLALKFFFFVFRSGCFESRILSRPRFFYDEDSSAFASPVRFDYEPRGEGRVVKIPEFVFVPNAGVRFRDGYSSIG